MLTRNPSEKVDFLRAPPAKTLVNVPLGVKFPVCPKQPVQFCTNKLSEKLIKQGPSFDLEDPHCHLMKTTYNNLHDPYLKDYYQGKEVHQCLRQKGFITDDDMVVCTLKDYNEYRNYLSSLHRKKIRKMLEKKNGLRTNDAPKISVRKIS
ncbi:fibrous sheath-interacting protein 2-like [Pelobates fuscus]|uniref:fibrous sheath-interacting protein 2-like n=1 Tax=Pelobates fuscus TaxID=191477 RepID=UPI002FE4F89E